jgi:hypothetical protein
MILKEGSKEGKIKIRVRVAKVFLSEGCKDFNACRGYSSVEMRGKGVLLEFYVLLSRDFGRVFLGVSELGLSLNNRRCLNMKLILVIERNFGRGGEVVTSMACRCSFFCCFLAGTWDSGDRVETS